MEHRRDRLEVAHRQLTGPAWQDVTLRGFHRERVHKIAEARPPVRIEIQLVAALQRAQPEPARTRHPGIQGDLQHKAAQVSGTSTTARSRSKPSF